MELMSELENARAFRFMQMALKEPGIRKFLQNNIFVLLEVALLPGK